jgi:nitroreductase
VSEPAECEQVILCTNWGRPDGRFQIPPEQRATGYIIILSIPSPPVDPAVDVGIAAQTIQLAASAAGYASCMVGDIDRARLQKVLGLPAELKIQLLLGLGRAGEKVALEELPPGSQAMFWRTPDGVHHVAKRKLEDVMV